MSDPLPALGEAGEDELSEIATILELCGLAAILMAAENQLLTGPKISGLSGI